MPLPLTARCALLAVLTSICQTAHAEKLSIERIFAAPDLSGATLRSPQISPDGRLVAYLRGSAAAKDRLDLWAYDMARRRHVLLVDSARLVPAPRALSAEEAARRERARISSLSGIVDYQFSPDSRQLLVPLDGDLYLYDLKTKGADPVRLLTHGGGAATDARFSPLGRYVSFIRGQNLYVVDIATGSERALTRDGGGLVSFGTAEFIAQEEMDRDTGYWWSPDDQRIAYTRVDESPIAEVERVEVYADGAKVVKQRYPAAGGHNALVTLIVADLDAAHGSPPRRVDLGANPDFYLARVNWLPGSAALAVQRESRDQKTLALLRADARTGATHEILSEHSNTWVELNDELTLLKTAPNFIWASSRSGYRQLYLYDIDGRMLRQLTSGEWQVEGDGSQRAVLGVDEKRGLVYFMANADSPLERQLYTVSLRDAHAAMRRITTLAGWHSVTMADDTHVFLDTFSTPDKPPSVTLRRADGAQVTTLVANELTADHPYAPYLSEHLPTEFGSLRASDGQSLDYQLIKPRDLVPGRRYPVIVNVYGGPGVQYVRRAWGGNEEFYRQYLAQHGYVVFTLDNRGSGFRGVAFETPIFRHLGTVEVDDQLAGVEFLKSLPYVDTAHIGIFGWSYGGYMALMCTLRAPGVFAASVAGAPVTDWRLYDTHYTERYLGTPADDPEGYAAASVLEHAATLRGALLIVHGMADDNVLFAHSTLLFKRLQDLNEPFDVMVYPGAKHALLRHADTGPHAYATVARFLAAHLNGSE